MKQYNHQFFPDGIPLYSYYRMFFFLVVEPWGIYWVNEEYWSLEVIEIVPLVGQQSASNKTLLKQSIYSLDRTKTDITA